MPVGPVRGRPGSLAVRQRYSRARHRTFVNSSYRNCEIYVKKILQLGKNVMENVNHICSSTAHKQYCKP